MPLFRQEYGPTDEELRAQGKIPTVAVLTAKGGGKSAFARWRIRTTCHNTDWFVVDPEKMHWPRMYGWRATIVTNLESWWLVKRERPGWVYIFQDEAADGEAVAAIALATKRCSFLHDEGDSDTGNDRAVKRGTALYRMTNRNRQKYVAAFFLFRRCSDVWPTVYRNATTAILGCAVDGELKRIEEEFGSAARAEVEKLGEPGSNPDGVELVVVKLRGKKVAHRIFIPHRGGESQPTGEPT